MSTTRKELELADEQTTQRLYAQKLRDRAQHPVHVQGPRNNLWTGTGMPAPRATPNASLVGRVALTSPDPDLEGGADFYIGEAHANIGGVPVFSWAAPVACTFFRGTRHHEWCDDVVAIRAFVQRNGQITDFAEEVVRVDVPAPPFRRRGLSIPAASRSPGSRPLPKAASAAPARDGALHPDGRPAQRPASLPAGPAGGKREPGPPVRAEALLRSQLLAPRGKGLAAVLSTLQPDQYDLVTVPAMDSMIIEGQPGTGKTIIASHRAAYLVNEETPPENTLDGDILLIGPTVGYSNHVRGVVSRLTGGTDRVKILAVPELAERILGLKSEPRGPASHCWQDADRQLGVLARKVVDRFKSARSRPPTTEDAYQYLRLNGEAGRPVTTDPEWIDYLNHLPFFRDAKALNAHTPLLACIKWEADPPSGLASVELVIVDEAQDVTPLEWFLLGAINKTDAWTLLGDLNQRRSDHTLASWQHILDTLGLLKEEAPIRRLQRGYRSTKPILEYANRLLPRTERALLAFQTEGPAPTVIRTSASLVPTAVVGEVVRLLGAYPAGTVAVISAYPGSARSSLRSAGWAAAWLGSPAWERDGRTVMVLSPDDARGLEFDGVVVVEPANFPQNYRRWGPLYTALTRPNRELSVVHSKPLPDALRSR
jgi:hypothetical protein